MSAAFHTIWLIASAPSGSAPAPPASQTPREKLGIASTFLLIGLLATVLLTVVTLLILRRARWAHGGVARKPNKRTRQVDAWAESASRAINGPADRKRRPHLGDSGSDDDTVDIDPDELGPDDVNDDRS